jgi:hypothetical protein
MIGSSVASSVLGAFVKMQIIAANIAAKYRNENLQQNNVEMEDFKHEKCKARKGCQLQQVGIHFSDSFCGCVSDIPAGSVGFDDCKQLL